MTMTRGSRTEPGRNRYSRQSGSRDYSTASTVVRDASTSTVPRRTTLPPERRHTTRGLVNPGAQPTRQRRLQHKTGSQQVLSVRGRRVVAPRANPRMIQLFTVVVLLLCVGVGASMGLSGVSTQQTYDLQNLKSQETELANRIESLTRDVEDARSAATIAATAGEMGMVSPVEPGVLAVRDNGEVVEERPASPETRAIVDINNGTQVRPNRASSNPDETSEVTESLQVIPPQQGATTPPQQAAAIPPYQNNSPAGAVPYEATARDTGGQAGGIGQ
ncbi:hypothetical protein [Corynebacterium gallinarum]|uniref:hypothetical protein n=1 Tax=Corynebacterium gallinarum TaxID=2762214 RepID=UPI001CD8C79F|nr:hypothetical protein [Corynebacterium gallinarum]